MLKNFAKSFFDIVFQVQSAGDGRNFGISVLETLKRFSEMKWILTLLIVYGKGCIKQ